MLNKFLILINFQISLLVILKNFSNFWDLNKSLILINFQILLLVTLKNFFNFLSYKYFVSPFFIPTFKSNHVYPLYFQ